MAGSRTALLEIPLVIFLGAIERGRGGDFGDDGPAKASGGLGLFFGFARDGFLFGRMEENRRAILRAEIGPLAVELRGVVDLPESFQKLFVTQLFRVKRHLHDFGVTGPVGAHVLVRGVCGVPTRVAHNSVCHAGHLPKRRLNSPKTSRAKCSDFHSWILPEIIGKLAVAFLHPYFIRCSPSRQRFCGTATISCGPFSLPREAPSASPALGLYKDY